MKMGVLCFIIVILLGRWQHLYLVLNCSICEMHTKLRSISLNDRIAALTSIAFSWSLLLTLSISVLLLKSAVNSQHVQGRLSKLLPKSEGLKVVFQPDIQGKKDCASFYIISLLFSKITASIRLGQSGHTVIKRHSLSLRCTRARWPSPT